MHVLHVWVNTNMFHVLLFREKKRGALFVGTINQNKIGEACICTGYAIQSLKMSLG